MKFLQNNKLFEQWFVLTLDLDHSSCVAHPDLVCIIFLGFDIPIVFIEFNFYLIIFQFFKLQIDTNECGVNNGGCNHDCINIDGSYECTCNDGYKLDSDMQSCIGKCAHSLRKTDY